MIRYIARATKFIHHAIKTSDLGLAGTSNLFGEEQLSLDVLADRIIMDNLKVSGLVANAISEESEEETVFEHELKDETYSVAYDPLDGSSLVDTNLAIGSIFSIYKSGPFIGKTGREQVAALYAVYGPRTTLVYTTGKGVHEFTLNDVYEYSLTREDIKISDTSKYFAPGNLRAAQDNPKYKKLVDDWMLKGYTLRYSGGMVPDLNHILLKGQGIFTYPPFPPKYPNGKLRLLFECNPFAFLMEMAGGASMIPAVSSP
ncbi:fructose-1,6-bisphosphatase [Candidatus Peregrinibacteria bacterium]|nr:fructose-1,6-bisphosphatase [Candidatus Peregrinibacteria bacterium]